MIQTLPSKKIKIYLFIFFIFIISRVIIYNYFGIRPDQNQLEYGWHLIKPFFLKNYFLESIKYLHFQPPLWNFFVGILFQIFEKQETINQILHMFNILLTSLTIFFCLKIFQIFFIKYISTIFLSLLIIFNPGIIFYENLPASYIPFTTLLLIVIFYYSLIYFKNNKIIYEIYIYSSLVILSYIWSMFNYLLIIIFYILILFNKLTLGKKIRFSNYIFLFFLLMSIIPSIKNYILFNKFSNGDNGIGWQIAMTTSSIKNDFYLHHYCSPGNSVKIYNEKFYKIKKIDESNLSITLLPNEDFFNFNQLGRIIQSEECLNKSIEYIRNNFNLYLKSRINEFFISHGQLAIDMLFITGNSKSFDKIKDFLEKIRQQNTKKKIKQFVLISYFILIYLYFILYIFNLMLIKKIDFAFIFIFFIYIYMILCSLIFANYEGSRFIQAGFIIQIIFWIHLTKLFYKIKNKKNAYSYTYKR